MVRLYHPPSLCAVHPTPNPNHPHPKNYHSGTVNQAIAEVICTDPANPTPATCHQKAAPIPHSHGVAVQFIEKQSPLGDGYTCVDMDSCDTATNFDPTSLVQCGIGPDMTSSSVGSNNYPGNTQPNTNFPDGYGGYYAFSNPAREARCAANPNYYYW